MSAFVVNNEHLDAMLTVGLDFARYGPLRWFWPEMEPEQKEGAYSRGQPWGPEAVELAKARGHELTSKTAGRVGAVLAAENRRSVDHRYDETEDEEPYVFKRFKKRLPVVALLKLIDCYEYQACEHPEWESSEARAFCESLRRQLIHQLPGYEEAQWGL